MPLCAFDFTNDEIVRIFFLFRFEERNLIMFFIWGSLGKSLFWPKVRKSLFLSLWMTFVKRFYWMERFFKTFSSDNILSSMHERKKRKHTVRKRMRQKIKMKIIEQIEAKSICKSIIATWLIIISFHVSFLFFSITFLSSYRQLWE